MKLKPGDYIPSLRWRQGEYQALFTLSDAAKNRVVPFIVIPELEFDFEEWAPKKTVQDHVEPFTKRFKSKWGMRPAWIDVHPKVQALPMASGKFPIAHVFDELHTLGSNTVPVTSLDSIPQINGTVAAIVKRDGRGVGIRARVEHIMKPTFKAALQNLMLAVGVGPAETDLIVDLGSPNYQPYEDFADALISAMSVIDNIAAFRSYVLMGSAYPQLVTLDKPGGDLPRHDWMFYWVFASRLPSGSRVPHFGDYTIVNPEFTPQDMRLIKSGGKIVYTHGPNWHVRKGGAFRTNPAQMHDHCQFILSSGKFQGADFSDGDDYIQKCATHAEGPSNQTRWKRVAISHHIMHVLADLAMPAAAA